MWKWIKYVAVAVLAVSMPVVGQADEHDAPKPYVYGIYYECDVTRQELADEIVDVAYSGAFDAAVEAGDIQSWGWLAHHTGNTWRRLLYHSAPDLESVVSALESVVGAVDEKYPGMSRAFNEACGSHVDYIWQNITGSRAGDLSQDRGDAGFSVYFVCDMSREQRADEIVKDAFAPVFNQHVGDGKLTTWGWMQHVVGGTYRRIWTMSAADHSTLLATREAIFADLEETDEAALREFDDICGSHQDMMWNIVMETP